jgi:hypothetical protein
MPQKNFVVDEETALLLQQLRNELKLKSDAALLRRSLSLLRLAAEHAKDSNYVITMRGKNEPEAEADNYVIRD